MWKNLLDTATNTGLDAAKTAVKMVAHKIEQSTGELIGNNIDIQPYQSL